MPTYALGASMGVAKRPRSRTRRLLDPAGHPTSDNFTPHRIGLATTSRWHFTSALRAQARWLLARRQCPPPRSPHQRRGLLRSKACRPTSARSRWRQMFVLLKRCWRHHPTPQPSKPDLLDAREVAGSKARTSMILVKGSKRSEHSRSAAVTAHARGDDSATLGPPAAAVMLPDKMVYLYLRTPEVCKCCSYSIVNEDNS